MASVLTPLPELVYIESHTCGACGVIFGMSREFIAQRKRDRETWYCPNGHPRVFAGPTEESKLRNQLAAVTARADQLQASLASQRSITSHERAKVRGLKGVITRVKKRVGNGVCPCCNRTFQDLARHMGTKHPEYSGEAPDA